MDEFGEGQIALVVESVARLRVRPLQAEMARHARMDRQPELEIEAVGHVTLDPVDRR
jgi:hypothetical protein